MKKKKAKSSILEFLEKKREEEYTKQEYKKQVDDQVRVPSVQGITGSLEVEYISGEEATPAKKQGDFKKKK